MATISIKLEGITNFTQMSNEVRKKVIAEGAKVINKHTSKIQQSTKSKIKSHTGEMASLVKQETKQGEHFAIGNVGTIGASAEDAKKFTAYEYGHAAPGDAGGVKVTKPAGVLRSSLDEDKTPFRSDMKNGIKKAVEG